MIPVLRQNTAGKYVEGVKLSWAQGLKNLLWIVLASAEVKSTPHGRKCQTQRQGGIISPLGTVYDT